MATFGYNPITGQLDLVGSGASYIDGVVANSSLLPTTTGTPAMDAVYLAKAGSGVWLINRRPAGLYCRTANNGVAADWTFLGAFPEVNSDANWRLFNATTTTKELAFDLSGLPASTTRTVGAPAGNGLMLVEGQSIGSTTPAAATFTNLIANAELQLPTNAPASPSAGDIYRSADTLRYRDSANTERTILSGADNLANLSNTATARTNLGLGTFATANAATPPAIGNTTPAAITGTTGTFSTLTANNGTLTASAPVLDLSQTWNNAAVTFTGVNIAISESASAAGSRFFDVKRGATSIFSLRNFVGNSADEVLGIQGPSRGFIFGPQGTTTGSGFFSLRWQLNLAGLARDAIFAWGTDVYGTTYDLAIQRDAADTLAQRRLANPQTFRLYNTTDAGLANYERGFMRWSSNVLQIGSESAGSGTSRNLELYSGGALRMTLSTASGVVLPGASALAWGGGGSRIIGATSPAGLLQFQTGSTDRITIDANGIIGIGGTTSSFPALKRSSTTLQVRLADDSAYSVLDAQLRAQGTAPATSGATGTAGDIRYDADYIYVCTAANTWKRAAIATW